MPSSDVGRQRCPDSVRVYCTVSVRQNLKLSVGRVFECPNSEFELDFDLQTPHSKSGQNSDSAVRRRLPQTKSRSPVSTDQNQSRANISILSLNFRSHVIIRKVLSICQSEKSSKSRRNYPMANQTEVTC